MAALNSRQTDDGAIELVTSLSGRWLGLGTLQFILGFLVFSMWSDDPGSDLAWVALVLFGLSILPLLINLLTSTTVRIDPRQRQVSRMRSILTLPLSTETLAFNDVTRIRAQLVSRGRARGSRTAAEVWQLLAIRAEGNPLTLNKDGRFDEMDQLGKQVAEMIGCVYESTEVPVTQPVRRADGTGQSAGPAFPTLPPVAPDVLMPDAPSAEHEEFERDSGVPTKSEPTIAPNTLMPDSQSVPQIDFDRAQLTGDADTLAEEEKEVPPNTLLPDSPSPVHTQFEADASAATEVPEPTFAPPPPPQFARMSQSALEQTVSEDASQSDAWFELARRYAAARRWNEMANALRQVIKYDPMNGDAQNDLGVALYYTNSLDEAEAAFNRAMALDLFNILPRLNLAITLRRHGRGKQAETVLADAQQYSNDAGTQRLLDSFRSGAIREPLRSHT
jgi:hypothetical protein